MLYHGIGPDKKYRVGAVLMDLQDPRRIIARTKDYLMEPDQTFELSGFYEGCVFPTGTLSRMESSTSTMAVRISTSDLQPVISAN